MKTLLVALALLAVAACEVSSPMDLSQDRGSLRQSDTCGSEQRPC
jgi:hypothetical protein